MNDNRPLWAPWRIDFIRSEKENRCFLCDKQHCFDSPDEDMMIYRGRTAFVILNRFPYNSGHLMVSPYRHIADLAELTAAERVELTDLLISAKKVLQELMHPQGFNVGFNLGVAAGAGVADHIHQHLVPRWVGDTNFMPVLGATRVIPEALTATAELIRSAWKLS